MTQRTRDAVSVVDWPEFQAARKAMDAYWEENKKLCAMGDDIKVYMSSKPHKMKEIATDKVLSALQKCDDAKDFCVKECVALLARLEVMT